MTEHVLVSLISGTEYDDLNRILAKFIHHIKGIWLALPLSEILTTLVIVVTFWIYSRQRAIIELSNLQQKGGGHDGRNSHLIPCLRYSKRS